MHGAGGRAEDRSTDLNAAHPKEPTERGDPREDQLPARFIRIKQITEIDKTGMLTALKNGEDVPGARLVTERTHLRIR